MITWIDGALVAEPVVSIFDRGFLYGEGLFEVLRTWGGRAVDLDLHLARMYRSARALGLAVAERAVVERGVAEALAAAGPGDHRIRIVVTGGQGPVGEAGRGGKAIVVVEPVAAVPESVTLATVPWPLAPSGAHKTLGFFGHLAARELAARAGAAEALRVDGGEVRECATANVFVVIAGHALTPPLDGTILPGITRARVLGLGGEERRIAVAELIAADEVFVTSAVRGVVAVTAIDGVPRPAGPVTARIVDAYRRAVREQSGV